MNPYNSSRVYKIHSDEAHLTYYGSTRLSLVDRFKKHVNAYNRYTRGNGDYCSSFKVVCYSDAKITLVESVNVESKQELMKIEAGHIVSNECVNKNIPCRTNKQYYNDKKSDILESKAQYYIDNRESILKIKSDYYAKNKQRILERQAIYRELNKDRLKMDRNSKKCIDAMNAL